MPLSFPTQAEQCEARFRESIRTVSITTLAKTMGADKARADGVTTFTFDDDTSLTVVGRGKSHKVQTHLP